MDIGRKIFQNSDEVADPPTYYANMFINPAGIEFACTNNLNKRICEYTFSSIWKHNARKGV